GSYSECGERRTPAGGVRRAGAFISLFDRVTHVSGVPPPTIAPYSRVCRVVRLRRRVGAGAAAALRFPSQYFSTTINAADEPIAPSTAYSVAQMASNCRGSPVAVRTLNEIGTSDPLTSTGFPFTSTWRC